MLHDDTVGALYLPKGNYTITLLDPAALSCAEASDLFRQFLEDLDGRLPRPWVVDAQASTFTRGAQRLRGLQRRSGRPAAAAVAAAATIRRGTICPGTFQVLHDDHIGTFAVPKGHYLVTLLVGRPDQLRSKAAAYLGALPGRLRRRPARARGSSTPRPARSCAARRNVGFRIKELAGPPAPAAAAAAAPTRAASAARPRSGCSNNDSIGRLRLRKGPYRITLVGRGGLVPARLAAVPELPAGLRGHASAALEARTSQTATFTRGGSRSAGFRVKPAR